MNITGVNITQDCVLDCGQVAKPGDNAVVIEILMRCDAVAMCYMKEVIEAALSNVAKQRLTSLQANQNRCVKEADEKATV